MVQEVTELTPDAYLMIVYGKDKDTVQIKEYDTEIKQSSKNLLNNVLKSNIATVALAGFTSAIGQNIAGKALSNATLGRINSSIYDIMSDGKINVQEVAEDFIGSCTNALDNAATDAGYPTPSSLYTALTTGSGVISKDFTKILAKKMDGENKENNKLANSSEITVLTFKIVTSDKESWSSDIPTRKTEKGFEVATAISNHNKTKDFDVLLCTDSRQGTDMYQLKNQLEEIRNNKVPFDVYVNDKDVYNQYKMTNCLFSTLSFTPNGKNTIDCSMSISEIPEWDVQMVKLDSTYKGKYQSSSSDGNAKSGVSSVKKTAESAAKTAKPKVQQIIKTRILDEKTKNLIKGLKQAGIKKDGLFAGRDYSTNAIVKELAKNGIRVSVSEVNVVLSEGASISAPKTYWDIFGNVHRY